MKNVMSMAPGFVNPQMNIPYVVEDTPRGERSMDIYSRLLKERVVYLGTQVVPQIANAIVGTLLFLDSQDSEKPIHFYINSPGGSVSDGLAIYDTMQSIKAPIHTYTLGMAASMGSFLAMAGEQGHRYAQPNSRIMIHQPLIMGGQGGGISGQVTDIVNTAQELQKTKEKLTRAYALHTGQDYEKLLAIMERDTYLTPEEAKNLGLCDVILESPKIAALKAKRGLK